MRSWWECSCRSSSDSRIPHSRGRPCAITRPSIKDARTRRPSRVCNERLDLRWRMGVRVRREWPRAQCSNAKTAPVVLRTGDDTARPHRLVVQRLAEGADLGVGQLLGRPVGVFAPGLVVEHQRHYLGPSPAWVYSSICRSPVELPRAAYGGARSSGECPRALLAMRRWASQARSLSGSWRPVTQLSAAQGGGQGFPLDTGARAMPDF
jgi:hypothetical protein